MMGKPNGCIFWDDLLKKYNTIWDKVSADIKKEFDIDPVYNIFFENENKIWWQWSNKFLW